MSHKKNTLAIATVHERAGSSDTSFSLGDVVLCLVFERKLKAMKDKSSKKKPRNMTVRAFQQWIAPQNPYGMMAQIDALVLDAIHRAKRIRPDADKTQLAAFAYEILCRDLILEVFPKRGRKPKFGLIGRAISDNSKRLSGRPTFVPPTKEREWLARVYGAKAGQFANKRNWSSATLADVVEHFGDDLLKKLDDEISDGEAAAIESVRSIFPNSSIEAIKTRIRRARRTFVLDLPKRKSGG